MKRVIVTMGIPGSGKSYATQMLFNQQEDALIINPDSIRLELTGDAADQTMNSEVFKVAHNRLVNGLLDPGTSVVVFDATNVQKRSRETILSICAEHEADTTLLVFDIDFDVCAQRNKDRERTVPEHAMVRMRDSFQRSMREISGESWTKIRRIVSANEEGVILRDFNSG